MVTRLIRALPQDGAVITTSTLPSGGSLPDPDCWVRRAGAEPAGQLSGRLSRWDPADVLLVVEVSDETVLADLTVKTRLYGAAGYPAYWVVTEQVVYEHTGPTAEGYRLRQEYRPGDRLPVGSTGASLSVDQLLSPTA
jgi:hypothetical protein